MVVKLLSIDKLRGDRAKYVASFDVDGRQQRIKFGDSAYEDYTMHRDTDRRDRYRIRHRRDNISAPNSAGALSWYILWGPHTSVDKNIAHYRRKFGL